MFTSFNNTRRRLVGWLTLHGRLRVAQPILVLLFPVLGLFGLALGYRWLLFIALCYGLIALVCYAWVRQQGVHVQLVRQLETDWAMVGDKLQEQWTLTNPSRFPLVWIEVDDGSTVPSYHARRVTGCGVHDAQHWTTSAICTRRGVYTLGPLHLRLGDPFGLFVYRWGVPTTREIVVYPPLVYLPPLALPQGQRGGVARADLLQQYATPSVGDLREYRPGDSLRHIHWPSVARTNQLLVKQFDQERAGAFWIVLDLVQQSEVVMQQAGPDTSHYHADTPLELAVTVAASLAAQMLGAGRAVGFFTNDGRERVVNPGYSQPQLWHILRELVDVSSTSTLTMEELLLHWQVHRGRDGGNDAALTLITAETSDAWVGTLAMTQQKRATVLLIDSQSFVESKGTHEQNQLQHVLGQLGIATYVFGRTTPLTLINPPRQREILRVSPLGRTQRVAADTTATER